MPPVSWWPDVLEHGPGERYLIQHSAGSGKTNSIAWTAHFLADLHDAQLQEAIFDFQRTTGVVATITGFKEPRQAIVFTRDGKTAYVLNEDLGLAKVDLASNRVEATLAAPAAKMQKTAP